MMGRWRGLRWPRPLAMAAVAALTAGTLSACSDDGAEGADATPSAAEATTSAEPSAVETTEAPAPTESESSEWTAEEAALIEEAEAFYMGVFSLHVEVAQEGFIDHVKVGRLGENYSGSAQQDLVNERNEALGNSLTMEGQPTSLGIHVESVSAGSPPEELVIKHCIDTSGIRFLRDGQPQDGEHAGGPRTIEDRLVRTEGVWTIAEKVGIEDGPCES